MKGPGIFLSQFIGEKPPFNSLNGICQWAKDKGFCGIQLPTSDERFIDLRKAAESKTYSDELKGIVNAAGLEITELSTHLQGHLIAVHPAYDTLFAGFAPVAFRKDPKSRQLWAVQQLKYAAKASQNLGLTAHATFSGSLLWHTLYPWPQRPEGLVEEAFKELAERWLPILNTFDECGVDLCYEIHPGEDLHDGISFEMFLEKVDFHQRACLLYDPSHLVLQCLDYLAYIHNYHERIRAFHVKDASFNPSGKQGVYGGYQNWANRAGHFSSTGEGQVDFKSIFSILAAYGYTGWAVFECYLKNSEAEVTKGATFIKKNIIQVTEKPFDDFAKTIRDDNLEEDRQPE